MGLNLRAVGVLVPVLTAIALAGPLAAVSQGAIPPREKKATFTSKVEVSQTTNWRHYDPNGSDPCTGERYIYDSDGAETLLAEADGRLRFRRAYGTTLLAEWEVDGRPGVVTGWSERVPFFVDVARSFNESREVIVPGGPSGCGGCEGTSCTPDEPDKQPDCGERSTFGVALLGYGYSLTSDDDDGKYLGFIDEGTSNGDYASNFAPYESCPTWGPDGLIPFEKKLSPKAIFGDKRKLVLRGKVLDRQQGDNAESYSETVQEWKIVLKRKRGGD